jgi:sulfide dehydrogenase [flavocytochrome c] flavoprotein subunit
MRRRHILLASAASAMSGLVLANDRKVERQSPGAGTSVPNAATVAHVIVVGGGMAGATVAKYLRLWSAGTIAVTLVERETRYTSCILSSLVLTGQRTLDSLKYSYDRLRTRYGVKVVFGNVTEVDPVAARIRLADGSQLQADRLVLAPGIEFDAVPGLDNPDLMPHAWKAGPQTTLLADQLAAMPAGGTVILTVPPTPYRCPPGPYERACLIADWLKQRKPGSKLLVLDANADFVTEADNFGRAFFDLHGSVIDYRTQVSILSADGPSRTLTTNVGNFKGDVVNLIPRQRAGALLTQAGLANSPDGRFAGVDVLSYTSTAAPLVHVIGDSSATTQPKAGHIANQEAKVCADALVRRIAGGSPDPKPVTNSACYSTITMSQASWLNAVFQYDTAQRVMAPVAAAGGASTGWSSQNFSQMNTWFGSLMSDTFA